MPEEADYLAQARKQILTWIIELRVYLKFHTFSESVMAMQLLETAETSSGWRVGLLEIVQLAQASFGANILTDQAVAAMQRLVFSSTHYALGSEADVQLVLDAISASVSVAPTDDPLLTDDDLCDRCSATAAVRVELEQGELFLCKFHAERHAAVLAALANRKGLLQSEGGVGVRRDTTPAASASITAGAPFMLWVCDVR